jgi:energy-coupling factor transport system permease protein
MIDLPSKLALVLFLWVCAFTLPWQISAGLCLLVIIGRYFVPQLRPLSDRSAKAFSRFILYSLVVATLVVLLNAALVRGGMVATSVLGISFYEAGLSFGLTTASRLLLLSFSILMFFVSTPLPEFFAYLQRKGLPPSLVMVLLLTLHFLDQLPERINRIFLAQQARGAPVDAGLVARTRALLSILSPLVLSSIVESIERGTALELRGFMNRPTESVHEAAQTARINVSTVVLLTLSMIVLFYAVYRWLMA